MGDANHAVLFDIVDKWDNILYSGYNVAAGMKYLLHLPQIKKITGGNKRFKGKHEGERCFIVLNGPSLQGNDLSLLADETVFCTNYLYKSDLVDIIKPNYYCWMDSRIFTTPEEGKSTIKELQEKLPDVDLFLNFRAYNVVDRNEHTFFTYNKHMPSTRGFRNKIDGFSSGYTNVLGYVIGVATYMGFKEIYILGLDFNPSGFQHFEESVDGNERQDSRNHDTITHYGSTLKAHSEFIGIAKQADKMGIAIRNLNAKSFVRAFDFAEYNKIIRG